MQQRKLVVSSASGPTHVAAVESVLLARFHAIIAHLAVTRYDDGQPRQPGTLLVRTVGATWQLTAKEPDVGGMLPVLGDTFDEAVAALSVALSSDQTPWQPDPWARANGPKRRRKGG